MGGRCLGRLGCGLLGHSLLVLVCNLGEVDDALTLGKAHNDDARRRAGVGVDGGNGGADDGAEIGEARKGE